MNKDFNSLKILPLYNSVLIENIGRPCRRLLNRCFYDASDVNFLCNVTIDNIQEELYCEDDDETLIQELLFINSYDFDLYRNVKEELYNGGV